MPQNGQRERKSWHSREKRSRQKKTQSTKEAAVAKREGRRSNDSALSLRGEIAADRRNKERNSCVAARGGVGGRVFSLGF